MLVGTYSSPPGDTHTRLRGCLPLLHHLHRFRRAEGRAGGLVQAGLGLIRENLFTVTILTPSPADLSELKCSFLVLKFLFTQHLKPPENITATPL